LCAMIGGVWEARRPRLSGFIGRVAGFSRSSMIS
jgi:hypothetical protein